MDLRIEVDFRGWVDEGEELADGEAMLVAELNTEGE